MQPTLIEAYGAILTKAYANSTWALADEMPETADQTPTVRMAAALPLVRFFGESALGTEQAASIGRTRIFASKPGAIYLNNDHLRAA